MNFFFFIIEFLKFDNLQLIIASCNEHDIIFKPIKSCNLRSQSDNSLNGLLDL